MDEIQELIEQSRARNYEIRKLLSRVSLIKKT